MCYLVDCLFYFNCQEEACHNQQKPWERIFALHSQYVWCKSKSSFQICAIKEPSIGWEKNYPGLEILNQRVSWHTKKVLFPPKKCELSHIARIVLFSTNRWRLDGIIFEWRFWCKYVDCVVVVINNVSWYCNKNFKKCNWIHFVLSFFLLFITIYDFLFLIYRLTLK